VLAAVTTLSFDIAALELYLPLMVGARIQLVPKAIAMDGPALAALLESAGATIMQATPATWRLLLEAGWSGRPGFRALCGGEPLARELADALLARTAELWNLYGPTETTVWSTLARVEAGGGPVPVGRPIANTQVYVLDRGGHPLPCGVSGEIWIGGAGVAEGYHEQPALTAERFRTDPFYEGGRMYRTGDLGCWRAGGVLEHLGRIDHQVKVRGFRIELGEIESVLAAHPAVRQAVVVAREETPGDVRLVGYLVPEPDRELIPGDIRRHLRSKLPEYMVPPVIMALEAMPLTPNGKIDRRALPPPNGKPSLLDGLAGEGERIPPRDALEAQLAVIWEAVLNVPVGSVRDSFFDLGGHSLLATRLFARIEKATGVALPLAILVEGRTIEALATHLRARLNGGGPSSRTAYSFLVAIQKGGARAPLFCVHGAGGNVLNLHDLARHLPRDQPFYGLQAAGVDGTTRPMETIEEMADGYLSELRALQPSGPYFLSGYCGGGVVAYEMAQRLLREGETVALLGLIDLYRPGLPLYFNRLSSWKTALAEEDLPTLLRRFPNKIERELGPTFRALQVRYHLARGRAVPFHLRDSWLTTSFVRAVERYQLRGYPGKLTIFRASAGNPLIREPGPDLGWADLASDGVVSHVIPGGHHSITREPSVQILAARLTDALRAAEGAAVRPEGERSRSRSSSG
jgi:thioesterase domain-containing protein